MGDSRPPGWMEETSRQGHRPSRRRGTYRPRRRPRRARHRGQTRPTQVHTRPRGPPGPHAFRHRRSSPAKNARLWRWTAATSSGHSGPLLPKLLPAPEMSRAITESHLRIRSSRHSDAPVRGRSYRLRVVAEGSSSDGRTVTDRGFVVGLADFLAVSGGGWRRALLGGLGSLLLAAGAQVLVDDGRAVVALCALSLWCFAAAWFVRRFASR